MSSGDDVVFIYSTVATLDDAERIAVHLVESRLAACANMLPGMRSVYVWKGEVQRDDEAVLILKTRRALQEAAIAAVRAVHPYEVPAITAFAASGVDPAFAAWIFEQTADN